MSSENKRLIIGLGNIGADYTHTRHNVGFLVADALSEKYQIQFASTRLAFLSSFKIKNKYVTLLKPTTFMNLSGKTVAYYLQVLKINFTELIVITDDIALPFGEVRIRKKGGAGGHNGLQSIIDSVGTVEFTRLRIGIGSQFVKGYQSDYVLGKWDEVELLHLPKIIDAAVQACEIFVLSGSDIAMNVFNKKIIE